MADTTFPPQTDYVPQPPRPLAGHRFSSDLYNDQDDAALVPLVADLPQIFTLTVTSVADGNIAVTIDGATTTPFAATGDNDADALTLAAAVGAVGALAQIISVTGTAANVITVQGLANGYTHVVADASTGSSTVAFAETQAASAYSRVTYGMGVDRATSGVRNVLGMGKPTAIDGVFLGVVELRSDSDDLDGLEAQITGFDKDYLIPGSARYTVVLSGGVWVDTTEAVTFGDKAYHVKTGANAGKFAKSSGAVSQVTTITFTGQGGGGTAAGHVDDLDPISVNDGASNDANAAAWAAAARAHAAYVALAGTSGIVAATNVVTITYIDDQAHTFTDDSAGGTCVLTDLDTTNAVAASAVLINGRFAQSSPAGRAPLEFNVLGA